MRIHEITRSRRLVFRTDADPPFDGVSALSIVGIHSEKVDVEVETFNYLTF